MQPGSRKALFRGAFFVALLALPGMAVALCPADRIDAQATVRSINDGDTVVLEDGRRLRLIGINTPELGHGRRPDEPLAAKARDYLRELLTQANWRIALRYDLERQDRYKRLLAHAYLPDGRSIAALLAREGLAHVVTVPPNGQANDCLWDVESTARRKALGVWQIPRFAGEDSRALSRPLAGFRVVEGRVERVGEGRDALWLNLPGRVAIRLARDDLLFFRSLPAKSLLGRRIRVRGWARVSRGETRMQLRHPSMLKVID